MKTAIVLGKGTLAINVAASMLPNGSGYKLVGIVPVLPAPMWCEDFWSWAKWAGTGVACYEHHNDIPDVDLVVSAQYDKILKKDFLERHGKVVNIHFSPLPRYRGVRPINWALKNGEIEHGVTIHEVDEDIDTGPIIAQVKFSIFHEMEVRDVYAACIAHGTQLWLSTLPLIDVIEADPQEWYSEEPSYYGKDDIKDLGDRGGWTR